jgi:hypothetical protein
MILKRYRVVVAALAIMGSAAGLTFLAEASDQEKLTRS